MADNYLERHREEYEEKKARWMLKKNKIANKKYRCLAIEKPDDESL